MFKCSLLSTVAKLFAYGEDFCALFQYKGLGAKHILLEKPIVDLTISEIPTIILKM